MTGFIVKVNGNELATVSTEGLNILSVQVAGDLVSEELAQLQLFGGYYAGDENDTHFIWLSEYEIASKDEINIIFAKSVTTSHAGKTIEELHPKPKELMGPWLPMEEMFYYLSKQPKLRNKFSFKLVPSIGDPIFKSTNKNDYMFSYIAMWKLQHPENATVRLTSNSLQGIENKENGIIHARLTLQYEEGVKLKIGT